MFQEKRNPVAGDDRVAGWVKALGRADFQHNIQDHLDLQVASVRRRFNLSDELAAAVAAHVFGRAA